MRLAVNILSGGRYYREGDEVDESLVPSNLRRLNSEYAAKIRREREDADEGQPAPRRASVREHPCAKAQAEQRYVRRGYAFRKVELESLVPGERLYARKAGSNAFLRVGRVPKAQNAL